MMHHPTHWIAVALIVVLMVLLARGAHGQQVNPPSTDASAMFEGRPALAGAQAGLGAQAGPPQGGIGLQGNAQAELGLRPPRMIRDLRAARHEAERKAEARREDAVVAANNTDMYLLSPRFAR